MPAPVPKYFLDIQLGAIRLVVFAFGFVQEATGDLNKVGYGPVQAASIDIQVHLVLRLIRHNFYARWLELAHGIILVRGGFAYANSLPLSEAGPANFTLFLTTTRLSML